MEREREKDRDSLVPRPFEVEEKVHAWYTLFVHDRASYQQTFVLLLCFTCQDFFYLCVHMHTLRIYR